MDLRKIDNAAKYLDFIDQADASPELIRNVRKNSEDIFVVCEQDTVVGLALIEDDSDGYVYVYIFPSYRNKGYGSLAVRAAEQQITASPLHSLTTECIRNHETAKRFAEMNGYMIKFASAFMGYSGGAFPEPDIQVRKYRDEDFTEAFAMTDEAFHIMRLGTGWFPDSTLSEPDEDTRKEWAENTENEYVLIENNEIVGCAEIDGTELNIVAIKTSHQGKGLGRKFVKYLVNRILDKNAGDPTLWCVVGNNKARKLYDSLGFKEICCVDFAEKKIGQ